MASLFAYSATWLARVRFALPAPKPALTTGDCALALYAIAQALSFDGTVIYERSGRTLRDHMRDRRDGVVEQVPYPFGHRLHLHDLHICLPRTRPDLFAASVRRVATMIDCGEPLFDRFELVDDVVEVELARATFGAHPSLGRSRGGGGRLTASVDLAALWRMSSVSSVHLACRLAAWWQANTTVGIQGQAAKLDVAPNRFHALVPVEHIRSALGLVVARTAPSFVDMTLDRMRGDLRDQLDVRLVTSWWPTDQRARYLDVEALHHHQIPLTHDDVERIGEQDDTVPTIIRDVPAGRLALRGRPRTGASVVPAVPLDHGRADDVVTAPTPSAATGAANDDEQWHASDRDDDRAVDDLAVFDDDDEWREVPGYAGRDEHGRPTFADDWSRRALTTHWYPDVVYPVTDPADPTTMVTVLRPDWPGAVTSIRRRRETHPPCPDVHRVPHRHGHGAWTSESEDEIDRDIAYGVDPEVLVAVPGETEVRWCRTVDEYEAARRASIAWSVADQARRAEADRTAGVAHSGIETLRREAREELGLNPDDASRDDQLPQRLFD